MSGMAGNVTSAAEVRARRLAWNKFRNLIRPLIDAILTICIASAERKTSLV